MTLRRAGAFAFVLVVVVGCSSGTPAKTQADCDKIADDIRAHGGTEGICNATAPAIVARFGKACADLRACEDAVDKQAK